MSAQLHRHFLAINDKSFSLQIWLPNFLGMTLRKTDVIAKLLAFTSDITLLHREVFYPFSSDKSTP